MKKIKLIFITLLLSISTVGCVNTTSNKAIEQGKLAMASKEYDKALGLFQLAIDEGNKDEDVLKMFKIINKYNEVKDSFNEGKVEEAKKLINEINVEYKNYAIKDDVDKLKKEINEKYKDSEKIKLEIGKLDTLFENKKYDEVNSIISSLEDKKLTKDQVEVINDMKKKITKENEVAISESLQYNQSKKYEYLQKLNKIQYEVSKISYDGDTLQMKQASSEVLKKWDDMLNEIYGVLKKQLSSYEMELLKKEQRQWISDRDFIAEEEASEFGGGTMEGLQYTETLGRLTKERCYELVEIYMK